MNYFLKNKIVYNGEYVTDIFNVYKIVDKLKSIPIFAYRLITLKSVYYGEN